MPAVEKGLIFNTGPYMHSKNWPVKLHSKNWPVKLRRNISLYHRNITLFHRKKGKNFYCIFACLGLEGAEKKIAGYKKIKKLF